MNALLSLHSGGWYWAAQVFYFDGLHDSRPFVMGCVPLLEQTCSCYGQALVTLLQWPQANNAITVNHSVHPPLSSCVNSLTFCMLFLMQVRQHRQTCSQPLLLLLCESYKLQLRALEGQRRSFACLILSTSHPDLIWDIGEIFYVILTFLIGAVVHSIIIGEATMVGGTIWCRCCWQPSVSNPIVHCGQHETTPRCCTSCLLYPCLHTVPQLSSFCILFHFWPNLNLHSQIYQRINSSPHSYFCLIWCPTHIQHKLDTKSFYMRLVELHILHLTISMDLFPPPHLSDSQLFVITFGLQVVWFQLSSHATKCHHLTLLDQVFLFHEQLH